MTTGDVEIGILDGGAGVVVVPSSSVQVVIGPSSIGTAAVVSPFRDVNKLAASYGVGPGVEAAALAILNGGTVIFLKSATSVASVASAVLSVAVGGTSVVTVTGTPLDSYLVKVKVITGCTIGVNGGVIQISVDAGRNFGPSIAIGTASTYVIVGTGITINFAAGTLVATASYTFSCTEPTSSTANVQACLVALEASQSAVTGWGSMHIVGIWTGANASTIEGFLDTMVTTKTFTRAIIATRDNLLPAALWSGAGETDAVWSAAVVTDYSAVSAKRICAFAGHYNQPSAYTIAAAGSPRWRRPAAWAVAARRVSIGAATHGGRVDLGALSNIVIDPTNDPSDGFNYHDELQTPVLDAARFGSLRKRKGRPGFFIVNENLMSPGGSVFTILPLGNVMDIGCALLHQTGEVNVNADVALNPNGTIDEIAAQAIETVMRGAFRDNMTAKRLLSSTATTVQVDRTNNVQNTSIVNIAVTLYTRGYILEIDGTIGFASPFAAGV